jgi:hypothetical protein
MESMEFVVFEELLTSEGLIELAMSVYGAPRRYASS